MDRHETIHLTHEPNRIESNYDSTHDSIRFGVLGSWFKFVLYIFFFIIKKMIKSTFIFDSLSI